jgi:hypothetical protein
VLVALSALTSACGGDGETTPLSGDVSGRASSDEAAGAIWVAVIETGSDDGALRADLKVARTALGDYYADQVVITDAACYEGLPASMQGTSVLAIQDESEHGVHALYLELTDEPPFYGEVTLTC